MFTLCRAIDKKYRGEEKQKRRGSKKGEVIGTGGSLWVLYNAYGLRCSEERTLVRI